MPKFKIVSLAAVLGLLGGCAQTVWVRPDTTQAEAQHAINQCDYESAAATPSSNIHLRGRRTMVHALAEGLLEGIDEGIRKGNLFRQCMIADGFIQQTVQPAPAIQYASTSRNDVAAIAELPPVAVAVAAPLAPASTVIKTPIARPLLAATAVAAAPQLRLVDNRTLVTTYMMELPESSRQKASFLLGACSAGDVTACILAEPNRLRRGRTPGLF